MITDILRKTTAITGIAVAGLVGCVKDAGTGTPVDSNAQQAAARPNIVFIMSDDHSERAISAYGSDLIETPNIDRIANDGVVFRNSFVANSICGPSRAIMLTGKHSHKNGFTDNLSTFDGHQPTYPQYLQQAGYQTAVVGKWHLKSDPVGFDYWEVLEGQGHYYKPVFKTNRKTEITQEVEQNGKTDLVNIYEGAYATSKTGDLALDFLEHLDQDKPFLLIYNHKAPHRNWMPDVDDLGKIDTSTLKVPDNFYDNYEGRLAAAAQELEINDMHLSYDLKLTPAEYQDVPEAQEDELLAVWNDLYDRMTDEQKSRWDAYYSESNQEFQKVKGDPRALLEWKYRRYMHDYLGSIVSMDRDIGRVLDYLDENGLAENTIVVYTSDQGFFIGEHGWFDKRFMYEETMRTPLIMRYPAKIKPRQNVTEMVQNIDYAPTLLEFAGVSVPKDIQGISLAPLLTGKSDKLDRDSLYYHYYEGIEKEHKVARQYGIRTGSHKLIHFKDVGMDHWEMYDLGKDPQEMINVYDDPAYTEIRMALHGELVALRNHYDDTSE